MLRRQEKEHENCKNGMEKNGKLKGGAKYTCRNKVGKWSIVMRLWDIQMRKKLSYKKIIGAWHDEWFDIIII